MTKETEKYKVTLLVNGKEFKAEEEQIEDCLLSLIQPSYKSVGKLTVEYNGKVFKKNLNIIQIKRMFNPKLINRSIASKLIKAFLK